MTEPQPAGHQLRTLDEVLAGKSVLLLDFDGPVCSIFAGLPAPVVAERLRDVARRHGVPADLIPDDNDPLAVIRTLSATVPDIAAPLENTLEAAELEAVRTARPTPGAVEVLHAARDAGWQVAVVSNNGAEAIRAYLRQHNLSDLVAIVAGRPPGAPELMKPSPHLIETAMATLGVAADFCVLIGDSVTDVQAAQEARVPCVGYANKAHKSTTLARARAATLATDMLPVALVIRQVG